MATVVAVVAARLVVVAVTVMVTVVAVRSVVVDLYVLPTEQELIPEY